MDYKFLAGWKMQVALAPVHKRERLPERGYNAADRTPQRKSTLLENQEFWGGSMLAVGRWLGVLLLGISLAAEAYAAPLIANERVTVWDVSLAEGVAGPRTPEDEDTVILFLEGGQIRTVDRTGKARIVMRNFGDAVFVPKGTDGIDTLVSGGPAHEVMISLKDHPVPAMANTSGYPTAFPRAGSVRMLDDSRFTAWHYSWTKGVPTGMHFHDKDFVVAFRYDSMQSILAPDGASHISPVKAGDILFLKRGLTHSEGLSHYSLAYTYLWARRYPESIESYDRALQLDPSLSGASIGRGYAHYFLGNYEAARASCDSPTPGWLNYTCLALVYDKLGRRADAQAQLVLLQKNYGELVEYQYAEIYAQWGDVPRALEALERAVALRDGGLAFTKTDSMVDPLRREPRFKAVLAGLKFPD